MENAKELWEDIKEWFSVMNGPRIQQLKSEPAECKQEGMTMGISRTKEERGEVVGLAVQIGGRTRGRGDAKDKSMVCGHCNRTRHDATNCFQVVGYPKWSFQWRNDSTSDGYIQGQTDRFEQ
ncbi:hypothetical protein GmHk_10G028151 [Glycine max]|nr:hypothetical protein GmHk_10G028151 [Glycine max]